MSLIWNLVKKRRENWKYAVIFIASDSLLEFVSSDVAFLVFIFKIIGFRSEIVVYEYILDSHFFFIA